MYIPGWVYFRINRWVHKWFSLQNLGLGLGLVLCPRFVMHPSGISMDSYGGGEQQMTNYIRLKAPLNQDTQTETSVCHLLPSVSTVTSQLKLPHFFETDLIAFNECEEQRAAWCHILFAPHGYAVKKKIKYKIKSKKSQGPWPTCKLYSMPIFSSFTISLQCLSDTTVKYSPQQLGLNFHNLRPCSLSSPRYKRVAPVWRNSEKIQGMMASKLWAVRRTFGTLRNGEEDDSDAWKKGKYGLWSISWWSD